MNSYGFISYNPSTRKPPGGDTALLATYIDKMATDDDLTTERIMIPVGQLFDSGAQMTQTWCVTHH